MCLFRERFNSSPMGTPKPMTRKSVKRSIDRGLPSLLEDVCGGGGRLKCTRDVLGHRG